VLERKPWLIQDHCGKKFNISVKQLLALADQLEVKRGSEEQFVLFLFLFLFNLF